MDILSNKSLAMLLMFSIIISLGGTLITMNKLTGDSLTGYGTSDTSLGTVEYNVSANVDVNFTTSSIDFGAGSVVSTKINCTLISNATINSETRCSEFTDVSTGLVLENIGNKVIQLNLSFSNDSAEFIHSTGSSFSFAVNNESEPSACITTIPDTFDNYNFTEIVARSDYTICQRFNFSPSADELEIDVKLVIPEAASGFHQAVITASAGEPS